MYPALPVVGSLLRGSTVRAPEQGGASVSRGPQPYAVLSSHLWTTGLRFAFLFSSQLPSPALSFPFYQPESG